MPRLSLQELVGTGYADFWKTKKRFRVSKGFLFSDPLGTFLL